MAGTACGGMDQTISIMGEMGKAKLIDFVPEIKTSDVQIPDSVVLVIANSCTASPKLLTVGTRYNKRVVECKFGMCAMSIKAGKCTSFEDCPFSTFQQLQKALGYSFEQMIELVNSSFNMKGEYTAEQISSEWNVADPFSIVSDIPHVMDVKNQNKSFELYKRAYHVLTEAKRVHDFKAVCDDAEMDEDTKVQRLGELMNESHLSCHMYYDCSSTQLEEVTQLARDSGALGSRLTGAGWGGCSVSLVRKSILNEFIDKMYTYYTRERELGKELWITDDLERYLFATSPAQGACIIDP
jgi:N-acetylgalactosamine kinase